MIVNHKNIILTSVIVLAVSTVTLSQEKKETTLELSCLKKSDNSRSVIAKVKAGNEDNKLVPGRDVAVNFYYLDKDKEIFFNKVFTDEKGRAEAPLQAILPLDTERYFSIMARMENDTIYDGAEKMLRYKDVNLSLELMKTDTSQVVIAAVSETNTNGIIVPVTDIEVNFFVERLFGIMPVSEENEVSTDENGEALIAVPGDIKGDTSGKIIIVVRIEDNEQFGNIEMKAEVHSGNPLINEKDPFPRALWEPKAPVQMIMTFSILFGGIWVVYFFIFIQLFKMKHETAENKLTVNQ